MKKPLIGLVCAGGVTKSWMAKRQGFLDLLGPVKATSLRIASRLVNSLRAGRAVESNEAFGPCSIVFVAVPNESLPSVLDELAASGIDWHEKTLVVVDSDLDVADLHAFEVRRAATATLGLIDAVPSLRLVVQGEPRTVKLFRRLLEQDGTRLIEIRSGAKGVYLAGLTIAESLAAPLLSASVKCLTIAGLDLAHAQSVADASLGRARQAYLKAGRKGWVGTLAERDLHSLLRQWEKLRRANPALGEFFLQSTTAAAEYLATDPSWLDALVEVKRRRQSRVPDTAVAQ